MGGERAPDMVLRGADMALQRHPELRFLLFGERGPSCSPLLAKLPRLAAAVTLHHTDEVVLDDDKPSLALRTGRQSSMRLAIDAVADGRADGVVSAGNTGALMAMAKNVLKTLPGIDRPAIASFFPTRRGESVMLDLGANVECDAENLVQFALLGDAFARTVLGLVEPTVGLLNVGSEDLKGNDAVRAAALRLRGALSPDPLSRLHRGRRHRGRDGRRRRHRRVHRQHRGQDRRGHRRSCSASFCRQRSATRCWRASAICSPAAPCGKLRLRLDPRRYNGAVFLGLGGIAVKSHGSTDALGFANAIGVAVDMKLNGFLDQIRDDLARLYEATSLPQPASL